MPQDDPVKKALDSAKSTLAKANKFTQSVTGNPTDAFAAPAIKKPSIPQTKEPSYGLAREARDAMAGIKARNQRVDEYVNADKQ